MPGAPLPPFRERPPIAGTLSPRQQRFRNALTAIGNPRVSKVSFEREPDPWSTTIIQFDGGQQLSACFWRLIKDGQIHFTSFDFAPSRNPEKVNERIDSGAFLARELAGARLTRITVDEATGDLWLELEPGLRLEALRLGLGFEEWELTCAPGLGELSNYVLEP